MASAEVFWLFFILMQCEPQMWRGLWVTEEKRLYMDFQNLNFTSKNKHQIQLEEKSPQHWLFAITSSDKINKGKMVNLRWSRSGQVLFLRWNRHTWCCFSFFFHLPTDPSVFAHYFLSRSELPPTSLYLLAIQIWWCALWQMFAWLEKKPSIRRVL